MPPGGYRAADRRRALEGEPWIKRRKDAGSVACCARERPPRTPRGAAATALLGAVALLELLTAPAPARVVAPHLLLVAEHALLDDGNRFPPVEVFAGLQARAGLGRRGGHGPG